MCDYCDCRSHPEIADLSRDHERLTGLLSDLRATLTTGDQAGATRAADSLHDCLHAHAEREERGVFTQLRAQVGDAYVDMFEDDHAVIHALLAETPQDGEDGRWRLIDSLRDHILREESDLFPAAHQLLTPAQWDEINELAAGSPNNRSIV